MRDDGRMVALGYRTLLTQPCAWSCLPNVGIVRSVAEFPNTRQQSADPPKRLDQNAPTGRVSIHGLRVSVKIFLARS